ncbi:MAG: hypothetical protein ABIW80_07310 [Lapillicoccus sp.]
MSDESTVEVVGDHTYVLHLQDSEGGAVEIRVYANPEVVARLAAVVNTDEYQIIMATAAYLIARQRADDLPTFLELDDVAAAYDGYLKDISARLRTDERPRDH